MSETGLVEALARLREPFDDRVIGKLPRVVCKDCSDRNVNCTKHQRQKCPVCEAFVSTAHIHLDYVGHAETTDRLLSVDPSWNWEPLAFDDSGLPAMVRNQKGDPTRLWIRLTVCGVTRIGVGSVDGAAFDAEKQLIGDAIRNAAMRFGVALDLWAKSELESTLVETSTPPAALSGGGDGASPVETTAQAAIGNGSTKAAAGATEPAPATPTVRPPPGQKAAVVDTTATVKQAERSGESAPVPPAGAPSITAGKLKVLHAALKGAGYDTDDEQRDFAAKVLGHPVDRLDTLSVAEGERVVAEIKNMAAKA